MSARGKAVSKESLLTQVWEMKSSKKIIFRHKFPLYAAYWDDRHLLVTEFGCGYRFNINKSPTEPLSKSKYLSPLLPTLASILGRDKAVQELCALLDQYRLVTITGSGGVGKTRLAWEVVGLTHTHFPDGICVAELAHITEASSLLSVISSAPSSISCHS